MSGKRFRKGVFMSVLISSSLPFEQCTGCGACKSVCPKGAIIFQPDDGDFPYPQVDETKCIRCKLCEKTCPAVNPPERHPILKAYAAQCLDKTALKESTSGGVFTVFSRAVFNRGGVVYGCVWDDAYNAVIRKAENEEEMKPMRGSKYVWSYAGNAFPEIKQFLEKGRMVLFSGLPCQVAGLKKYLRIEYDNLYLLDSLCSGSPSPMVFHKYLDTICPDANPVTLNFKFRDKNPYGVGVHITYNGQKKKTSPRSEYAINPYYYAFYSHLIDRLSCYQCTYGTDQRISDFTMSDYWGINNYHADMDIQAGVSALMINTEKGMRFLESVRRDIELVPTKVENIGRANNLAYEGKKRKPRIIPVTRKLFLNEVRKNGWNVAKRKHLFTYARLVKIMRSGCPPQLAAILKRFLK